MYFFLAILITGIISLPKSRSKVKTTIQENDFCGGEFVIENAAEKWSKLEIYTPWYNPWNYELYLSKANEIQPKNVSLSLVQDHTFESK